MGEEESAQGAEDGVLVHLFRGKQNSAERLAFSAMCKKYGPDWTRMEMICPWRTKRNWCASWKKVTHIQAVGEFKTTKADPYVLRDEHRHLFKVGLRHEKYIYKNGMLVNRDPMTSMDARVAARSQHYQRFSLTDEAADSVAIPLVFPIEFMQKQMAKRRLALLATIAAIDWINAEHEDAKRDLRIPDVTVIPGHLVVSPPRFSTPLPYSTETDRVVFDLTNVIDGEPEELPF
jgi:hypothetical protein